MKRVRKKYSAWFLMVMVLATSLFSAGIRSTAVFADTYLDTGLESGQTQPTWSNMVEYKTNVTGYPPAQDPECSVSSELVHTGVNAIRVAGTDNSTSTSYCYFKVFDVNIAVNSCTQLSYWMYPTNEISRYIAVDLVCTDGTTLRDSGAIDTEGVRMHPATAKGVINLWTIEECKIGKYLQGKTIDKVLIGYDHAYDTGTFKGYIDDIKLEDVLEKTSTGAVYSTESYSTDFSQGASEWSISSGTWAVENGEFSCSGNGVALLGTSYKDFECQADIKMIGTGGERAGFRFRYIDSANLYTLHIAAGDPNIYLLKKVGGVDTVLKQYNTGSNFQLNTWYTLKAIVKGQSISAYLNNSPTPLFTVTDGSIKEGKIGLSEWTGAHSHFDNVIVQEIGEPDYYTTDFSEGASEWTVSSGTWAVEDGEFSGSGSGTALLGTIYKDFECQADIKMIGIGGERAGFRFRYVDSANLYTLHIAAGDPNIYLLKRVGGVETVLKKYNTGSNFQLNTWYTLKVVVKGQFISAYLNNSPAPLFTVTDNSLKEGKIGLSEWTGAHSHFDNVKVQELTRNVLYNSGFENDTGWSSAAGTWAIENGEYSGSSGYAVSGSDWTDYEVKVNVKMFNTGDYAGIRFRAKDASNYYTFCIGADGSNAYLYKTVNGIQTLLSQVDCNMTFGLNIWYNLKVRVKGSNIDCYTTGNSDPGITYTDTSINYGKIALDTWNDTIASHVHFDDIVVTDLLTYLYKNDFTDNDTSTMAFYTGSEDKPQTWSAQNGILLSGILYNSTGKAFVGCDFWGDYEAKVDFNRAVDYRDSVTHLAKYANDGSLSTFWSSGYYDSQTFTIDLGQIYSVDRIKIYWGNDFGVNYKIQVSNTLNVKKEWTDVYSTSAGSGGTEDIPITPASARWVKIQGIDASDRWGYSIKEIEVYSGTTNLALNKGCAASSTDITGFQNVGMYVRYKDDGTYYSAYINAQDNKAYLSKKTGTTSAVLAASSELTGFKGSAWNTLRVKCSGSNIKVYLEQKDKSEVPVIDYTDTSSPYTTGMVALAVWNDCVYKGDDSKSYNTAFDNFEVVTTETHKNNFVPGDYMLKSDFEAGSSIWSVSSGSWGIENEEYSVTGGSGTASAGDSGWTDYIMSTDFCMKNSGDSAGMLVRWDGAGNGYLISVDEDVANYSPGANVYIYKIVNNTYTLLKSQTIQGINNINKKNIFYKDVWFHMTVKVQGDMIEVYIGNNDPEPLSGYMSLKDDTFNSGKVGLEGWNDAASCHVNFDNVGVRKIPAFVYQAADNEMIAANYITDEKIIASFCVTDYGAVPGSSADASYAFQTALNDAYKAGGGVVWVPSGQYSLYRSIEIPRGVTLRGDWKNPDDGGLSLGTVIKVYGGKDNPYAKAAVTVRGSAGIVGMTFWYPEQDVNNVHEYPYTIYIAGTPTHGVACHQTACKLTLINSYRGIAAFGQELDASQIGEVYGTVLKKGLFVDDCWDVSRYFKIKFSPTYWRDSGFAGAPAGSAETTLRNYTRTYGQGMQFAHSDASSIYDAKAESYKIGIRFEGCSSWWAWMSGWNLDIDDCIIGIQINKIKDIAIANCDIVANTTGIELGSSFGEQDGRANVNTCYITSGGRAIEQTGSGYSQFQNITFRDWDASKEAVYSNKGSITLEGCTFQQDKAHITLDTDVKAAAILGNTFTGTPQITNNSTGIVQIDHTNFNFPAMPTAGHVWAAMRTPSSSNLYNVSAYPYNAKGDGVKDDTNAVQTALNTAGAAGGGTVYLPAGMYRLNSHLSVPSNVELRGVADTPHHTSSGNGTVLLAYEGKGDPNGTPLITLNQNAGVRGLTVWYPEQSIDDTSFITYPWTIRGMGTGVYIMDVTISGAYNGIDFGSYDTSNHYIRQLNGYIINQAIVIGKNTSAGAEGWIENSLLNPHELYDSAYPGTPSGSWGPGVNAPIKNLTFLKFGKTGNEHVMGAIVYASKTFLLFTPEAEGKFTGTLFSCCADIASDACVKVENADHIVMINSIIVPSNIDGASDPRMFFETLDTFTGNLEIYNTNARSGFGGSSFGGGNVTLQTATFFHDTAVVGYYPGPIVIIGGDVKCNNIYSNLDVVRAGNGYSIGSGITGASVIGCGNFGGFGVTDNSGGTAVITGNYYRQ